MRLQVTAVMAEPIIYFEDGMHLDGILAMAAYREYIHNGGDPLPIPMLSNWVIDFDLPLDKWTRPVPEGATPHDKLLNDKGDLWGWMASAVYAEWQSRGKMEYRKKPDTQRMSRYTSQKSHHLGAGPMKAFDLSYPTVFANEIRWLASGDIEEVDRLLNTYITHIGKKHATGSGLVSRWIVETSTHSSFKRVMPAAGCELRSIRAPYSHPSRFVSARMEDVL